MIAKLIMKYYQLIFHPASEGGINSKTIEKLFGFKNVFCSDGAYKIPKKQDIIEFLKLHIFRFRKYVPEKYDCDNYSFSLMGMFTNLMSGYAIGIVWVHAPEGNHALNFFINKNLKIWYIEPQTNVIFQNKNYKPYLVIM